MLLIKNGRVLNPATKTDAAMDVLLDGERIEEVAAHGKTSAGSGQSQMALEIFDASGLIVAPGFIDLHVPPARARAGKFRDDRNRDARGGARRIHGGVLHAEHAAGE